jgi:hypothetical protein
MLSVDKSESSVDARSSMKLSARVRRVRGHAPVIFIESDFEDDCLEEKRPATLLRRSTSRPSSCPLQLEEPEDSSVAASGPVPEDSVPLSGMAANPCSASRAATSAVLVVAGAKALELLMRVRKWADSSPIRRSGSRVIEAKIPSGMNS